MRRLTVMIIAVVFLSMLLGSCGGGGGGGGGLFLPLPPAKSSAKAITAYSFASPAATGTIDEAAKTISVTVPFGTNVAALVATFTTTGASVKVDATDQISGTIPNDFTNAVAYVVTAEDGSTATYTVTVTIAAAPKAITAFSFASPAATGVINESAKTIYVTVPHGTNVTALIATFITTGTSVKVDTTTQESGTTENDFTNPVAYVVTGADGLTATYTVMVKAGIDLPKTGQTTKYAAAGDDGNLQKGVAWPSPRFTDNTDGTVTDNLTGLLWLKNANCIASSYSSFDNDGPAGDGRVTWQHALDFVAGINAGTYPNCGGGRTGWRLPSKKELRSLLNYERSDNATWLNTQGFASVWTDDYWSSTTYAGATGYAWIVGMYRGDVSSGSKNSSFGYYVWPVNDAAVAPAISLPTTGQTTSFASGDDGALQKGVFWPNPRFATNGDTSVTDTLTGLVWAPSGNIMPARDNNWDQDGTANDGAVTWQHALDYVAKLNTESYLGKSDWRLPNANELESLSHAEYENNAAWLNTQGFITVQAANYWSSTTYSGNTTGAWIVGMNAAHLYYGAKDVSFLYVWPVRGGQ